MVDCSMQTFIVQFKIDNFLTIMGGTPPHPPGGAEYMCYTIVVASKYDLVHSQRAANFPDFLDFRLIKDEKPNNYYRMI